MINWDPALYLRFESDRNKPITDLLHHIELASPKRAIDIGCGPGNSTGFVARRWPEAEVIGLDSSKAMLETARKAYPHLQWVEYDATQGLAPLGPFDLVFSNAALQWMPDQTRVVPDFFGLLSPGGVLAVQIPHNVDSPLHQAMQTLAKSQKWRGRLPKGNPIQYHPVGFYYDILAALTGAFEIWTTRYHHVLNAHEEIVEWYKGTGFRPYLDQLDTPGQAEFLADMLAEVRPLYPAQSDGRILFTFERLFFVGTKIDEKEPLHD
ncbi:MAG: methyltransferase domain-containing protein [Firmicutes bacterium]|nr:methyltransferase domain-containing protein [Bacillota bacterium]